MILITENIYSLFSGSNRLHVKAMKEGRACVLMLLAFNWLVSGGELHSSFANLLPEDSVAKSPCNSRADHLPHRAFCRNLDSTRH